MSRDADIAAIKELLRGRIDALVRELAPEGAQNGRFWIAKNPSRTDNRAGSFYVWTKGNAIGAWKDDAIGTKGDILQLIQMCRQLPDFAAAINWARAWLDYKKMPAPARAAATADAAAKRDQAERAEAAQLAKDRGRAFMHWTKCAPSLGNTLAERYLAARGIELARLPRPPRALRYSANETYTETGERFPAIVALISDNDGRGLAIHRTFLAHDGRGKAPVAHARKIWPRGWAGGSIKLARGETALPPKQAIEQGLIDRMLVCEGVEDGLSLALACPEFRIWAAVTLGNLARLVLPACSDQVIVAADNDWGKRGAEAQLKRALAALQAQRDQVLVARSHTGKDANDALRGRSGGASAAAAHGQT